MKRRKSKATLNDYHRASLHIWALLTAKHAERVSLTDVCKMHGVSVSLPASMRRSGFIEGSPRRPSWVSGRGIPLPGDVRLIREDVLELMRRSEPVAPAATPAPQQVALGLDADAAFREELAELRSMVSTLLNREGAPA